MRRKFEKIVALIFNIIVLKRKNVQIEYSTSYDKNTYFEGFNKVGNHSRINNCYIGRCSYIGSNSHLDNCTIGRYCCIASNVKVIRATHPINFVSMHPVFFSLGKQCGKTYVDKQIFSENLSRNGKAAIIGHDVWIGHGAIIMGGIKIEDGAVVAAGAIVTKDVPAYSVVGGVPAKLIKYRFSEEVIHQLKTIEWWNKPEEWIIKNVKLFSDIDFFCNAFSQKENIKS